jgi:transposase-like protein
MPRSSVRGGEFWATVVAEARRGAVPRCQVAAKHGVTDAALKYHLYKSPGRATAKSNALALLPVRVSGTAPKQVELEFGPGLRLRFDEGCDPVYVAALVVRLRSAC